MVEIKNCVATGANTDGSDIIQYKPADSSAIVKKTVKDDGEGDDEGGDDVVTDFEYGFAANDTVTLHGKTEQMPINLNNDGDVSAFQFDIYLPEGITIAMNEDEEYEMTLNSKRATSSHSVSTYKQPNGAIRYTCYSNKSASFKGESGTELFTLPLTVAENIEGEFKVEIKNIILSSSDAQGYYSPNMEFVVTVKPYDLGDSNGDGSINIIDVVNTMNVVLGKESARFIKEAADINADTQINIVDVVGTMNIVLGNTRSSAPAKGKQMAKQATASQESVFVNDFTICATESKTIDLNMTNTKAYSAIQFDIVMPAGLTVDYDEEEEEYLFETTSRFHKSHSISTNLNEDCSISVGIFSNKSKDFSGNEGALISIPFTAAEDMAAGEYKVEIKNIVLSTAAAEGTYLPNTEAKLVVYPATMTGVEEVAADNAEIEYYTLQGVKVAKENLEQCIYIKKQGNKTEKVIL